MCEAARLSETVITAKPKYKKLNPWATKELADLSLKKQYWYKKKKSNPDSEHIKEEYSKAFMEMNVLRNKLKAGYMKVKADKCVRTNKSVWSMLKEAACTSDSSMEMCTLEKDYQIITNESEIANTFNDFFINVGPELARKIPTADPVVYQTDLSNNSQMELSEVTREEVDKIIQSLKNKYSSPDPLNNVLLKNSISVTSPMLTNIINASFKEGTFPQLCKVTQVKPLYKQERLLTSRIIDLSLFYLLPLGCWRKP